MRRKNVYQTASGAIDKAEGYKKYGEFDATASSSDPHHVEAQSIIRKITDNKNTTGARPDVNYQQIDDL